MIQASHLSHNFGSYWALKNISFHLEKGDFLFLCGPSGAGKTTLMRMLYGALPVARGNLRVADFDMKTIKSGQIPLLRRQVGVVFQDFKILPERTVYENIALPLRMQFLSSTHIERRVGAVLRGLELEHRKEALCGALSGGEQQRVAVARAIVVNPKVLLADEPTGNLDPELAARMVDIFAQFNAYGTTVIMATHNKELVARCPKARLLRLDQGKICYSNWEGGEVSDSFIAPENGILSMPKTEDTAC